MAANHIKLDRTTRIGAQKERYAQQIREGVDGLARLHAAEEQMIDGDGTDPAHFDLLASEAKFAAGDYADANAAAKASHDEQASLLGKLNSNEPVEFVRAAIDQFCARHGYTS